MCLGNTNLTASLAVELERLTTIVLVQADTIASSQVLEELQEENGVSVTVLPSNQPMRL